MAIEVSPDVQARIQEKIDSGEFPNAEAIVAEGLDLIDSRKERLETLRALIAEGVADVEAGRVFEFNEALRQRAWERAVQRVENGERPDSDVWP
jgi:antitoxin ParD1/3/4